MLKETQSLFSRSDRPVIPLHHWLRCQDAQFGRKSLIPAGKVAKLLQQRANGEMRNPESGEG